MWHSLIRALCLHMAHCTLDVLITSLNARENEKNKTSVYPTKTMQQIRKKSHTSCLEHAFKGSLCAREDFLMAPCKIRKKKSPLRFGTRTTCLYVCMYACMPLKWVAYLERFMELGFVRIGTDACRLVYSFMRAH
jgi:hypothetical protein